MFASSIVRRRVKYISNKMNGFLNILYFLRKSLTQEFLCECPHLYNGDVNAHAPKLLIAAVRVKLNGACKTASIITKNYKRESSPNKKIEKNICGTF